MTKEQLQARLIALEQLLEIGYANWMAQMTYAEFEELQRNLESRLRTIWPVDLKGEMYEADPEVVREAQGIAARFWKRVRDRERAIRDARKKNENSHREVSSRRFRAQREPLRRTG